MWRDKRTSKAERGGLRPGMVQPEPRPAGETPTCCGQPMRPQLAHAHDGYGHSLFVTIWRCAQCGKAVY